MLLDIRKRQKGGAVEELLGILAILTLAAAMGVSYVLSQGKMGAPRTPPLQYSSTSFAGDKVDPQPPAYPVMAKIPDGVYSSP